MRLRKSGDARSPARAGPGPIAALALLVLPLLALGLVAVASAGPSKLSPTGERSFPWWLGGPLHAVVPNLGLDGMTARYFFTGSVVAMFLAYVVCLWRWRELPVRWVIATIVALHAIFLLSPPLQLSDIFNYLHYGRMATLGHINPYLHLPVDYSSDSAYVFTTWHHLRCPYGPAFTIGMALLAPLGLAASYWLLKLAVVAASLGCVALLWRLAVRLGRPPVQALVLVALNPLVLVWGLGAAHNDFFELLLLLGAAELALRRREDFGAAAVAGAVAIKASAGLLVPIYLAAAPRRGRALLGMAVGGAALLGASLFAFGPHFPALDQQGRIVAGLSFPNGLGLLLGLGGLTSGLRLALTLLVAGTLVVCTVYAWRRRDWLTPAGWASVALLLSLGWALPWYVLWVLPFAALAERPGLRRAAIALSVFLMLQWVPIWGDVFNALDWSPHRTSIGRHNDELLYHYLQ